MHIHPTISLWQREEDGSYKAELDGFALSVKWRPESRDERRGFLWKAEGPNDRVLEATEVSEEIEVAMGMAEHAVRLAQHDPPSEQASP
jgi:hypothetical protein